jgi:hypothetical protein
MIPANSGIVYVADRMTPVTTDSELRLRVLDDA